MTAIPAHSPTAMRYAAPGRWGQAQLAKTRDLVVAATAAASCIRARARFAVTGYIEVSCNRVRLHPTLGYRTPAEVLTEFQTAPTAA